MTSEPLETPDRDAGTSLDEIRSEIEAQRWEVRTYPVDNAVCVQPGRGMLASNRRWYPRTERGLRRAIRRCQRLCDRMNAREERGRALAATVTRAEGVGGE